MAVPSHYRSNSEASPLSAAAKIAANLACRAGEFRRALARALHNEGMRITEIASLFEVSRQRVSALTLARRR
jgi:predicted XRE-type DNA-binding protein